MDKNQLAVLLVEDDPDDQFFFKEALKSLDQSIPLAIVSGTLEALEHIRNAVPSIIFLDINMPGLSGKECLKRIRSDSDYDHIIIVMLTTSSRDEDIEECFNKGAHIYAVKPLSHVEQIQTLKRIFFLHLSDQIVKPTRQSFIFDGIG